MKSQKFFWYVFPVNLLIIVGAMLAVTWYGSTTFADFYRENMAANLTDRAWLIEEKVTNLLVAGDRDSLDAFCRRAGRKSTTRITVILPSGEVVADSDEDFANMENHRERPEFREALAGQVSSSLRTSATLHARMLYVAVPLYSPKDGSIIGGLRTSVAITALDRTLVNVRIKVFFGMVVVILLAAGATMVGARLITRPLEELRRCAEHFAAGDFAPSPVGGPLASVEVFALANAMNRMAANLRERFAVIVRQHNELESVFASMLEAVILLDVHGRVRNVNTAANDLLDMVGGEVKGRPIQEVSRNVDLHRLVSRVLEAGQAVESMEIVVPGPGGKRYLQASGVRMVSGPGNCFGALLVMNDITRLHRLERVRRDFVANVSHEMKTPVTSIKGYAETILDGEPDMGEQTRRFMDIIVRQADQLHAIIDDLLALSRIEQESETRQVELRQGPLAPVLEAARQVCQPKALGREIAISLHVGDEEARINVRLLEQAVVNLLDNAINASDPGGRVELFVDRDERGGLRVIVRDHGMGIAEEHLPRLFERFYRTDKARSRKLGGTGLGLAIVKHIVLAHNGRVGVSSKPGKGSSFTITLPAV